MFLRFAIGDAQAGLLRPKVNCYFALLYIFLINFYQRLFMVIDPTVFNLVHSQEFQIYQGYP